MTILLYLVSIILSWFFMRLFYKLSGSRARYYPHYLSIGMIFIPFFNLIFSLLFAGIETLTYIFSKLPRLDYKKVFNLK